MDEMVSPESTKAKKQRRDLLIKKFFCQICDDGSWKKFINSDGSLKLTEARKVLGVLEGGDGSPALNEDYFKSKHTTYIYRQKFELWVKEQLSELDDHELYGGHLNMQDLGLPLWLEEEVMSDSVRNLIVDQAKSLTQALDKVKKLQVTIDSKERKILELKSEKVSRFANFYVRDEEFSLGIRSLRYD